MPQYGKVITDEGLQKDLQYLLRGIDCHGVLAEICPPRYGMQVLEPGCGSGKLGLWFAMRGCLVTLLDIDPQALEYARRLDGMARTNPSQYIHWDDPKRVKFVEGSILHLPYEDSVFDFVFNEGVPHHWGLSGSDWRRQRAINEMVRVTAIGGWTAVIGSNALCPQTTEMAQKTEHTYLGMPPKQRPFKPAELAERLLKAGLARETVQVRPVFFGWGRPDESLYFHDTPLLVGYGRKL